VELSVRSDLGSDDPFEYILMHGVRFKDPLYV